MSIKNNININSVLSCLILLFLEYTAHADPILKLFEVNQAAAVQQWVLSTPIFVGANPEEVSVGALPDARAKGRYNKGVFIVIDKRLSVKNEYVVKISEGCWEFDRLRNLKPLFSDMVLKSQEVTFKFANVIEFEERKDDKKSLCFGLLERAQGAPLAEQIFNPSAASAWGRALGRLHAMHKLKHGDCHANNVFFEVSSEVLTWIDNASVGVIRDKNDLIDDLEMAVQRPLSDNGWIAYPVFHYLKQLSSKIVMISSKTGDELEDMWHADYKNFSGQFLDRDLILFKKAMVDISTSGNTIDKNKELRSRQEMQFYLNFMKAYLQQWPNSSNEVQDIKELFSSACKSAYERAIIYAPSGLDHLLLLGKREGQRNLLEEMLVSELATRSPELFSCMTGEF